jgi:hypothetical protein
MVLYHVNGGSVERGIKESGIIGLLLSIRKRSKTERGRNGRGIKDRGRKERDKLIFLSNRKDAEMKGAEWKEAERKEAKRNLA